ncbi:hypothetical protein QC764_600230 [Podospora pseudoanserina]|uniref:RING-type domain-containing protein n=1 Tax=Podospora pseudoanserina TaxID=2609844 RepID=A0ABR0HU95_9PEZI|nr:hypothetical protein QC764_600230 [Podospora pseudoanserina]
MASSSSSPRRALLNHVHQLRTYLSFSPEQKARRPVPFVRCDICRSETGEIITPATPGSALTTFPLSPTDRVRAGLVLPCGHMFHTECWDPYPATFRGKGAITCPRCRLRLNFSGMERNRCADLPWRYHMPEPDNPSWKWEIEKIPKTAQEYILEGREAEFELGAMCNVDRLIGASLLGKNIEVERDLVEGRGERVELSKLVDKVRADGWFFEEEIDLAFPGWLPRMELGDIRREPPRGGGGGLGGGAVEEVDEEGGVHLGGSRRRGAGKGAVICGILVGIMMRMMRMMRMRMMRMRMMMMRRRRRKRRRRRRRRRRRIVRWMMRRSSEGGREGRLVF